MDFNGNPMDSELMKELMQDKQLAEQITQFRSGKEIVDLKQMYGVDGKLIFNFQIVNGNPNSLLGTTQIMYGKTFSRLQMTRAVNQKRKREGKAPLPETKRKIEASEEEFKKFLRYFEKDGNSTVEDLDTYSAYYHKNTKLLQVL